MKKKYCKNKDLINQVNEKLNEKKLFQTNQKLLISISGGQDSSCLVIIFLQLRKQWHFDVGLIWCNHLWQLDSFYITKHIFNIFFFLKLPIYFNITTKKIFTEQKARNWRYEKFYRHYNFYSYDVIITGHTGSDQIETLLFHLFRGSSPKGLCSLNWIKYKIINQKYFFCKLITFKSKITIFQLKKIKLFDNQLLSKFLKIKNSDCKKFYKNKKKIPYKKFFYKKQFNLQKPTKKNLLNKSIFFYSISQPNSLLLINNKLIKINNFNNLTEKKHCNDFFLREKFSKKKNNSSLLDKKICRSVISLEPFSFQLKYQLKIIRPLLIFNRFDVKQLCEFWKLPIYPDKTNEQLKYSRNQIRKQLLPTLRFFFNPQVDHLLNQFIEILNEEQNYFEFLTNRLKDQLQEKQKNKFKVNFLMLRKFPLSIQRKILEKILKLKFNKNITFFHIETVLTYLEKKTKKQINDLPSNSYLSFQVQNKHELNLNLKKNKFNKNNNFLLLKKPFFIKQKNKFIPTHTSELSYSFTAYEKRDFEPPILFFFTGIGTISIYYNKIVMFTNINEL